MKQSKKILSLSLILALLAITGCNGTGAYSSSINSEPGSVINGLNDEKILFSINKGSEFKLVNDKLPEFDIWNVKKNDEVEGKIFFYAYAYEEFVSKIYEIKDSPLFEYSGYSSEKFDGIVESYDQSHFDENIALFYYKFEPNISENYIHSVTKTDDTVTLNVNRFQGAATALSSWLDVVTIKKADIKDVTKIDLIVRTISPLVESVTIFIDSDYSREFYVNPLALKVFNDLGNVKDIVLFNWSLSVDLKFNAEVTNEDLLAVVSYLEKQPNVKSVGYKGRDFIRVQMIDTLYDKVVNKTLVVSDLIKDQKLINKYNFYLSILDFIPFSMITFVLEKKGKIHAEALIEELKNRNYPFMNDVWSDYEYY